MPWAIGACAWIFGNRPLVALAADLFNWGYDGLELSGEPGQYDSAGVRQALKDSGLRVLGVTASCNWPTDARDLANPDPAVRRRAVDHFRRCLDLARGFVDAVASPIVGVFLDAYHMNIEEADPAEAIRAAGEKLLGLHVADTNRGGLGEGHLDLRPHISALRTIGYGGSIIVECTAPGPDPFRAIKDASSLGTVQQYAAETVGRLRALLASGGRAW